MQRLLGELTSTSSSGGARRSRIARRTRRPRPRRPAGRARPLCARRCAPRAPASAAAWPAARAPRRSACARARPPARARLARSSARARRCAPAGGSCAPCSRRRAAPPGGSTTRVGRELEALPPVELLRRADQPDDALLDQIEQRQAVSLVPLRDRHDEPQVRVDQRSFARLVAALDPLRELDLLLGREQRVAARLVQEELQRVGRRGCDLLVRVRDFDLHRARAVVGEVDPVAPSRRSSSTLDVVLLSPEALPRSRTAPVMWTQPCSSPCSTRIAIGSCAIGLTPVPPPVHVALTSNGETAQVVSRNLYLAGQLLLTRLREPWPPCTSSHRSRSQTSAPAAPASLPEGSILPWLVAAAVLAVIVVGGMYLTSRR